MINNLSSISFGAKFCTMKRTEKGLETITTEDNSPKANHKALVKMIAYGNLRDFNKMNFPTDNIIIKDNKACNRQLIFDANSLQAVKSMKHSNFNLKTTTITRKELGTEAEKTLFDDIVNYLKKFYKHFNNANSYSAEALDNKQSLNKEHGELLKRVQELKQAD